MTKISADLLLEREGWVRQLHHSSLTLSMIPSSPGHRSSDMDLRVGTRELVAVSRAVRTSPWSNRAMAPRLTSYRKRGREGGSLIL